MAMIPMLLVALLIWAGLFAFIFGVDRRLTTLEKRLPEDTADKKGIRE